MKILDLKTLTSVSLKLIIFNLLGEVIKDPLSNGLLRQFTLIAYFKCQRIGHIAFVFPAGNISFKQLRKLNFRTCRIFENR